MNITKTIMTIGMASAMTMQFSACKEAQRENPIEEGIRQQRENIQKIIDCQDSATFENTILAYEESGRLLDRVSRVFYALVEAEKTPEIAETEKKVTPMLTDLENEISFNKQLFERIKQVYDQQYSSLQGEDQKLLEETYKDFVRKGALLPDDKMERMKQINLRISDLQQQWGDLLPAATNDAVVWVDKKERPGRSQRGRHRPVQEGCREPGRQGPLRHRHRQHHPAAASRQPRQPRAA